MDKEIEIQYREVGGIGNYFGALHIMQKGNKFYWCVENCSTDMYNMDWWTEIGEELFTALEKEHLKPFKP